jgi:hypothetical protein
MLHVLAVCPRIATCVHHQAAVQHGLVGHNALPGTPKAHGTGSWRHRSSSPHSPAGCPMQCQQKTWTS